MTNVTNKTNTVNSQGPSPAGEVQTTGLSIESANALSIVAPPPSSGSDNMVSTAIAPLQRKSAYTADSFGKVASLGNVSAAPVQAKVSPGNFSSSLAQAGQTTAPSAEKTSSSILRMPLQLKDDRKDGNEEEGQENEAEDMVNIIEDLATNDGDSNTDDSKDSNDESDAPAGNVMDIIAGAAASNAGAGAEDAKEGGDEPAKVVKALISHAFAGKTSAGADDRKDSNGEDEGPEQEAEEVISNIVEQVQAGNAGASAEDSKDDGSEIMAAISNSAGASNAAASADDGKDAN